MKEENPFSNVYHSAQKEVKKMQPVWDEIAMENRKESMFTKIISVLALLVSVASLVVAIIALVRT